MIDFPVGGDEDRVIRFTDRKCDPPCAGRIALACAGQFLYSRVAGGYVMADTPMLGIHWRSQRAKIGPATFTCCPCCGGELIQPALDWDDLQADGLR